MVDNEIRPGDPGNYDVNWLRDGAYIIGALAGSRELSLAWKLVEPFATVDFFGGFGAEVDAPRLAMWILDEVSERLAQTEFDQWIWPHVVRKLI